MLDYLVPLIFGLLLGFGAGYAYGMLRSAAIIAKRLKNKKG